MCKGSNTTTQTTGPNPVAMNAYTDILNRAQGVASTPYTPYGGELVAGVNPQQTMGIGNINANANFASPYIQEATGLARSAAAPISASDINQYMSPYTQNVVNATQAQFNNQNAQQQQGVVGNAISQGALGGNRVGVAQAELANQQNLAQAPVIAGLQNQGYQTALNTALTEQQQRAAGAYSMGNLGVAGQNAGLTGANAQIGAGSLQQQTQQAQDLAAYQQFVNQQAFPYQQTQWLAGLGTGVGSQMGGTSSTTGPQPSMFGQAAGALTSGVGLLGGTGAFGASGWLAPAMMAMMARGGAVRGMADGGVAGPTEMPTVPETPETLEAQQRQLLAGDRHVQMFPRGTPELDLPEGMDRLESQGDIFHYNPQRMAPDQIRGASAQGRENEILGLGSISKQEVMERMRRGEQPVAIVERDANGTEVRAALGTNVTAPHQLAEMERSKSSGHVVRLEDPRQVLGSRIQRHLGGAVPHRDLGGATEGVSAAPYGGQGAPYSTARGWVPASSITRGRGAPPPPAAPSQQGGQPSLGDQAKAISQLAGALRGPPGAPMNISPVGVGPTPVGSIDPIGISPGAGMTSADALYRRGGRVGRYAAGGIANLPTHDRIMVPRGYADGGSPDYDAFDWSSGVASPAAQVYAPSEGFTDNPTQWNGVERVAAIPDGSSTFWRAPESMPEIYPKSAGFENAPPPFVAESPGLPAEGGLGAVTETGTPSRARPSWAASVGAGDLIPSDTGPGAPLTRGIAPVAGIPGGWQNGPGGVTAWPGTQSAEVTTSPPDLPPTRTVGLPPGGVTAPRGIRNNNPGNIEDGDFARSQPGYVGGDGRFAQFATPEDGRAAASSLLGSYGRRGVNTLSGIIHRWAPPSDKNDTGSYIKAVSRATGFAPDEPLDMADPTVREKVASAIGQYENGPGGTARPAGTESARLPEHARPVMYEPPAAGVAPARSGPNIDWSANSKLWPSLMAAGFGMLASRSPFPGVAIGEGGLAGLQTYQTATQQERQNVLSEKKVDLEAKRLAQQLDLQSKHLELQNKPYSEMTKVDQARLEESRRANQERIAELRQQHAETAAWRTQQVQRGNYELQPGKGQDENGNVVDGVYEHNKVTGETTFKPGMALTGKPGGKGQSASEWKYNAWLSSHPGDTQGALEFVAGHRKMSDEDINKTALAAAQRYVNGDISLTGKQKERERIEREKYAEYRNTLRGLPPSAAPAPAYSATNPPPGRAPAAAAPSGAPPPAAGAPVTVPERPRGVPEGARYQKSKSTGAVRWLAPDGTAYSADGVRQ